MEKYTILLVEDDLSLSSILKQVLERQNLSVDTAENGLVALEKIKDKTYDGIISDVDMPECDGIEFVRRLRKNRNFIPVLFYSGRAEADESRIIQSFGANGIISKQNVKIVGSKIIEMIIIHQSQKNKNTEDSGNVLLKEFEDLVYNCNS